MSNPLIISVSGLRGIVGESLDPPSLVQYLAAFHTVLPAGPVVVGRDGRGTGPMLAQLVRGTLMAAGRDVLDADVVATPTIGRLVRQHHAAGGVQITASHNPPPYNGIKLFGDDGRVVSARLGSQVAERMRTPMAPWVPHSSIGGLSNLDDTWTDHLEAVLRIVDVPVISARRFRVLLDANAGAGGGLGRRLLEALGCEVEVLAERPTGQFTHPPEPTAENLQGVGQFVRDGRYDVGFCQDPDADRLALIDETGGYVGEEYTLAICVQHVLGRTPGPIVTNCSSSKMTEDIARRFGVRFARSKVGEANVADEMIARQAVFGGEGNGGPIDPRVGYIRDSFVGMAIVLAAMAESGKTLSAIAQSLPKYAMYKSKAELASTPLDSLLARLRERFADAEQSELDGLRFDWPDRWLLVRASNTEPIVRLIAEATTLEAARQLCQEAQAVR